MNEQEHAQYMKNRTMANPVIARVWEVMRKNGDLDNVPEDQVLMKVLEGSQKVLDHLKKQQTNYK